MKLSSAFAVAASLACACLCAATAAAETNGPPIRLAVISESSSDASRNLADLLLVELAKRGDVDLVERADIDRVLVEQDLSASGMVSAATRVKIGEILKARGLLFINQANPTNGVLQLRLVETGHGYVAGFALHAAGDKLSGAVDSVNRMLSGLDLPLEGKVGASVLLFNNALPYPLAADPAVLGLMDGILDRITAEMAAISGVVIVERRKLGDVAREADLTGEETSFLAGDLFVDGGLSLKTHAGDLKDAQQVELTLRIRDLAKGTSAVVTESGDVENLREMADVAIEEFSRKALLMRDAAGGGQAAEEAKVLDAIARGYNMDWAGEASILMDDTDKARARARMTAILQGLTNAEDVRQAALAIAKVENLGRKHGISAIDSLDVYSSEQALQWMMKPASFIDPEAYRILQPLRARLLGELEALPPASGIVFDRRISWLRGIMQRPSTRRKYLVDLVEEMHANPGLKAPKKAFVSSYMMHLYKWKRQDLEEFRKSDDPVRRHYANYFLLRQERDSRKQIEYSDAMLAGLDDFIATISEIDMTWRSLFFYKTLDNHWISDSLLGLCSYRPEKQSEVQRKLFERMKELVKGNDIPTIAQLDMRRTLATIPDAEVFQLLDDIIGRYAYNRFDNVEMFLADARKWRESLIAAHPELDAGGDFSRRELMSHASYGSRLVKLAGASSPGNRKVRVYPQSLLLEGDTLWLGVGGSPYTVTINGERPWRHPFGLLQFDLKSGKVLSARVDWFAFPGVRQVYTTLNKPSEILRVGDYIATVLPSIGVVALPARGDGKGEGKRLSLAEGLPGGEKQYEGTLEYRGWIAALGDKLFIGLDQWLVEWDFATWKSQILLDVGASNVEVGQNNASKQISDVKTDLENGEVIISLSEVSRRLVHGTASRASYFRRKTEAGKWEKISGEEWQALPDPSAVPEWVSEALTKAKQGEVVAAVPWSGGIVVLQGSAVDTWRLVLITPKAKGGDDGK